MRLSWIVPFVTFPFAYACASGGFGDSPAGGGHAETSDSGPRANPYEEGGPSYDLDSGTDSRPGKKKGTPDGAVTPPPDSGADVAADASAPEAGPTDASSDAPLSDGAVVFGESCASPIDISTSGTFAIDTCALTNSVAASCGTTGAAAILRADAPITGSSYGITFPSGWVLQELDDTCAPVTYECGSTGAWYVSGATPGDYWYFAIEPASGTCGSTSITVDRTM